jgi:hypothetical protein
MTKESSKSNPAILIAIIGGLTTICAAAIGAMTTYNVEMLRQSSELTRVALVSTATQAGVTQAAMADILSIPTNTPEPPLSTYTPYPTYTPFPTNTYLPTLAFTPTPSLVLNLPFLDNLSDGIAPEWSVTGKSAIVDGYLRNTEGDKRLVLELNSTLPQTYTLSLDYVGFQYFNSGNDWNVTFLITIGNRFRVYSRNGLNASRWQSFENNRWIDIPGNMNVDAESGNLKLNVFNNTYQLFSNGQIVGSITYGEILPGPISISIGDNIGVNKIDITSP